ncbi:chaperone modulator CbpM [Pseudomonas sp.]|uniref:chaperone modulator CbpM n=1 Tax=Pseudomonas sp. TaxID=306 RepID=UPI002FC90841
MPHTEIVTGVVLDEVALDLDELAQACSVDTLWIVERVEAGLLCQVAQPQRFSSAELLRARRMRAIERDFDANPELAALVVDLIEEVGRLKGRLRAAGLDEK